MFDAAGLEILPESECLRLLGRTPVGRIVFTDQALPAVQPVNYVLVGRCVVLRTGRGSKLAAATRNAIVAFEADEFDLEVHRGWSVTAIGHAHEVTDPDDLAELAALPLRPWAPGDRDRYIRIRIERVTGRRIVAPGQRPAPAPTG